MIHASELRALAPLRGAVREVWIALKALVPPSGRRVSRATIAEVTGYDLRTVKRALNRLEEEGLVEIWRTDGGAHGNVNFMRLVSVVVENSAPGRDVRARKRGSVAQEEPTGAPRPTKAVDEGRAEEPLPAGQEDGAPSADRDACPPGDAVLNSGDRPDEDGPPEKDGRPDGQGCRPAADCAPETGGAAAPRETIAQAADRMVREFHAGVRGDDGHVPLRREVNLARRLLEADGAEAWELASVAVRSLHDQMRRGGPAPATFLYLLPHLTRAGARVGGGE